MCRSCDKLHVAFGGTLTKLFSVVTVLNSFLPTVWKGPISPCFLQHLLLQLSTFLGSLAVMLNMGISCGNKLKGPEAPTKLRCSLRVNRRAMSTKQYLADKRRSHRALLGLSVWAGVWSWILHSEFSLSVCFWSRALTKHPGCLGLTSLSWQIHLPLLPQCWDKRPPQPARLWLRL